MEAIQNIRSVEQITQEYKEKLASLTKLIEEVDALRSELVGPTKNNTEENDLKEEFGKTFVRLFPSGLTPDNVDEATPGDHKIMGQMKNRYDAPDFNPNLDEKMEFFENNFRKEEEK